MFMKQSKICNPSLPKMDVCYWSLDQDCSNICLRVEVLLTEGESLGKLKRYTVYAEVLCEFKRRLKEDSWIEES